MQGAGFEKKAKRLLETALLRFAGFYRRSAASFVAEHGASQIMIGTDYAVPWVKGPVDHFLNTPGLSNPERVAILGGTAAKLMKLPAMIQSR